MPNFSNDLAGKNTQYVHIVPYVNEVANQSRWGIASTKPTALQHYFDDNWAPEWLLHEDDTKRTPEVNINIWIYASGMESRIREICRDIPANKYSVTDFIELYVAPPVDHRSPIHAQNDAPDIKWTKFAHLENDIDIQNPLTPNSKKMPYGNKALILIYRGAAGLLDADIPWQFGGIAKTHIFRIMHNIADVNKTLYVKALYFHLDEKGNACEMIKTPII